MLIGTKFNGYSRDGIRLYFDPATIMATAAAETAAVATAAEIAAAEAAAIAAAEAAATEAAIQAASTAAAEAATVEAATQAGIMDIGGSTAMPGAITPPAVPITPEAVQAAATGQPTGIMGAQGPMTPEAVQAAATNQMTPAQLEYLQASTASNAQGAVPGQGMLTPYNLPQLPQTTDYGLSSASQAGATPPVDAQGFQGFQGQGLQTNQGFQPSPSSLSNMFQEPSKSSSGLEKLIKSAGESPFMAGAAMYMGASKLGLLDPEQENFGEEKYSGPLSRYNMSPNFQAGNAMPNVYKPTYAAEGGIMSANPVQMMSDENNAQGYQQAMAATGGQVAHFAKGGNLADSLDYYKQMMESADNKPAARPDVGVYYDQDPDTRYQDALTAAQIRNAKLSKRANIASPAARRPTPMGQINLAAPGVKPSAREDVQEAAGGGIMGASNLGGYAAGGSPRLLKGPGDGMSDNIPAVIGRKQPARLADGEFVIPADVVSHLGNGSTDAGAKRLHEMMNKVRKDRTGNPKQGKQINATKYMPK